MLAEETRRILCSNDRFAPMTGLRVLHVLDHSLPEVSGYSIRSHGILRALRSVGINARAVAQSSRVTRVTEEAIDSVPYIWVPRAPESVAATWRSSVARMGRLTRQLSGEVSRYGIALLHAHTPSLYGIPALFVSTYYRLPLIYEMRSLWEDTAVERNLGSTGAMRYRVARGLETLQDPATT